MSITASNITVGKADYRRALLGHLLTRFWLEWAAEATATGAADDPAPPASRVATSLQQITALELAP